MDAIELEAALLRLSLDTPAVDLEGGFKGHLILSAKGTKVFAMPTTVLKAQAETGRPFTQPGLEFVITHADQSPLTDYHGIVDDSVEARPIGVRKMTYDEFAERFGSLFAYNEIDIFDIDDPFSHLLERIPDRHI